MMLIGERVYRLPTLLYTYRQGEKLSVKYLGHCCFFGEKYYSDDEPL